MICVTLLFFIIEGSSLKTTGSSGVEILFMLDKATGQDFIFPEAAWLNDIGEPNLSSVLYKIGIPQDGGVEVKIFNDGGEVIEDVTIEPVRYAGIYEGMSPEIPKSQGAVYNDNRFFPEDLIEVSKPCYFRDIYTVDIRLNPIQYNPVTRKLKVFRYIKLNIQFKGKPVSKQILDTSFEDIYKETIWNYEQCRTWRRSPKFDNDNPFASGSWFKIEVSEEGLYRIGYDQIQEAGLDPEQFDPKTMKIYTAPFELLPFDVVSPFEDSLVEIPVYVQGEDDHSFESDDYLVFYGYPANHFLPDSEIGWFENGYARSNIYWFTFGGEDGKRMDMVDGQSHGSTFDTLVKEIIHIEEDLGNPTRSGINWYWQDISPLLGPSGSGMITVQHPRAAGNALVKVGIFTLDAGNFWYQLLFNNQTFFSDTLNLGMHDHWPPYYLSGNTALSGDSSELAINIIRPSGTGETLSAFLNGIDIQYERKTDMNLSFHAFYPTPGGYDLKCSQVNSTPFVFDVTNLKAPKMFTNLTIDGNNMFLSNQCDSFQLLYFSQLSQAKESKLIPATPGKLRNLSAGCEYLFITHKNFYNAITPLVGYRSQEYMTKVVMIDDIYDDFAFGRYDPLAIKHFLYYTTNNWTTVPKYVLLVGDATYDYKNNLAKPNPPNFIPMYESGTTLSGNPGIPPNHIYEGEYVNFGAGEAMILGRITVRTNQEVRDFIDKLITYETGNIDGLWNKRVILAGDDEWSNTYKWENPIVYHCGACERMLSAIPDSLYDITKIYMLSYPPFSYPTKKPNAQKDFIKELNKGCLVGAFYGHGNTHQLADEGLFYDTNISQINNRRRHFLYYFGSCTVGRFDDSDYECIGEQLVRIKDGAIGTLAATAATSTYANEPIGQRLFAYVTNPDTNLTMGECCFIARSGYWGNHYLLLGDPATRLRRIHKKMEISARPDSLRPLEQLMINTDENHYYLSAFIRDTTQIAFFDETTIDKMSGYVYRLVQSGVSSYTPFGYAINGKNIYQGYWDEDTAVIIVPKIATTHRPLIKLSSFIEESSGVLDSTRVFGNAAISADQDGPEVVFYDGGRRLKDGDWVNKEFTLTGKVADESGINLLYSVNNPRGFYLYVNQEIDNKFDLRDHFLYDRNSYTSGEFGVTIDLPRTTDTITVNVADNNDQQTIAKIVVHAEIYGQISIENFLIYPNPSLNNNGVWFTFNLTNSGLVTLKIFTIAGRLIKTIEDVYGQDGYNQIFWNTLDEYQDEISNGVYLIKAHVTAESSQAEVIEKFIIAR